MAGEQVFNSHPMSRGRIVRWMLEEAGQPYRIEVVDCGSLAVIIAALAARRAQSLVCAQCAPAWYRRQLVRNDETN